MPLSWCSPRSSKARPEPGDEVLDRRRDQDLRRTGEGADPGADVHGDAADIGAQQLDLAGVAAGAHLEAQGLDRLADALRALHGPGRPVEGGEEAVTGGLRPRCRGSGRAGRARSRCAARAARSSRRRRARTALSVEPTTSVKSTVASTRSSSVSSCRDRGEEALDRRHDRLRIRHPDDLGQSWHRHVAALPGSVPPARERRSSRPRSSSREEARRSARDGRQDGAHVGLEPHAPERLVARRRGRVARQLRVPPRGTPDRRGRASAGVVDPYAVRCTKSRRRRALPHDARSAGPAAPRLLGLAPHG